MSEEQTVKIKLLAAVCLGGGVDGDIGETHVVSPETAKDLIGAGQAEPAEEPEVEAKPNVRKKKS